MQARLPYLASLLLPSLLGPLTYGRQEAYSEENFLTASTMKFGNSVIPGTASSTNSLKIRTQKELKGTIWQAI